LTFGNFYVISLTRILIKKPVAKEIEPVFAFQTENGISGFRLTSLNTRTFRGCSM